MLKKTQTCKTQRIASLDVITPMLHKNKVHPGASAKATGGTRKEKPKLHPRNKHRERYDFKQLIDSCPGLAQFVKLNIYNDQSIDFFNPEAV